MLRHRMITGSRVINPIITVRDSNAAILDCKFSGSQPDTAAANKIYCNHIQILAASSSGIWASGTASIKDLRFSQRSRRSWDQVERVRAVQRSREQCCCNAKNHPSMGLTSGRLPIVRHYRTFFGTLTMKDYYCAAEVS